MQDFIDDQCAIQKEGSFLIPPFYYYYYYYYYYYLFIINFLIILYFYYQGYLLATFQTAVALLANETDPEDMAQRGAEAKSRQKITKQERKPPPLRENDMPELF